MRTGARSLAAILPRRPAPVKLENPDRRVVVADPQEVARQQSARLAWFGRRTGVHQPAQQGHHHTHMHLELVRRQRRPHLGLHAMPHLCRTTLPRAWCDLSKGEPRKSGHRLVEVEKKRQHGHSETLRLQASRGLRNRQSSPGQPVGYLCRRRRLSICAGAAGHLPMPARPAVYLCRRGRLSTYAGAAGHAQQPLRRPASRPAPPRRGRPPARAPDRATTACVAGGVRRRSRRACA